LHAALTLLVCTGLKLLVYAGLKLLVHAGLKLLVHAGLKLLVHAGLQLLVSPAAASMPAAKKKRFSSMTRPSADRFMSAARSFATGAITTAVLSCSSALY